MMIVFQIVFHWLLTTVKALATELEKMLKDEWNSRENFTENFEGILFVSAIYFV